MNQQNLKTYIKKRKYAFAILLILLIAAAITLLYLLWPTENPTNPVTSQEFEEIGAGDAPEQNNPLIPDNLIFDNPNSSTFTSNEVPNYEFEIEFFSDSAKNLFRIQNTSVEIPGVVNATWSADKEFIIFNKTETGCEMGPGMCIDDTGNMWVIEKDGNGLRRIIDFDLPTNVNYVSNGIKIAFTIENKVGMINPDGSGLEYLYEFIPEGIPGHEIYVPEIEYVDSSTFEVHFDKLDGGEEVLEFAF